MLTRQDVERLKAEARYRHAGSLAFIIGDEPVFGCHYGMRSSRDFAIAEFREAYFDAKIACDGAQSREAAR